MAALDQLIELVRRSHTLHLGAETQRELRRMTAERMILRSLSLLFAARSHPCDFLRYRAELSA